MSERRELPSPEEILARQTYDIPRLRLPEAALLFRQRARRLARLAEGHAIGDYLRFIGRIADIQQDLLDALPALALPSPEERERSRTFGMPPLNALTLPRDPAWRRVLRDLVGQLQPGSSGPLADVLDGLAQASDAELEAQAQALLAGGGTGLVVATAPLIGAALQVLFARLLLTLGSDALVPLGEQGVCPCCGSRPTASIARIGAQEAGYRYLHCALCALEWHRVRIQCAQCTSTKGIHYQSLDDGRPGQQHAVKAECCDECGTYLKILYMDRDPELDPVADDLATLALDLLVDGTGKQAAGVNFMLVPGEADD